MSVSPLTVLSADDVRESGVLGPAVAVDLMRRTLAAKRAGSAFDSPLSTLAVGEPGHRFVAHPASLEDIVGVKWIGANPENLRHGRPRASASVLLSDRQDGRSRAVVEATSISTVRTAAVGALAIESLVPTSAPVSLGVVGAGVSAQALVETVIALHPTLVETVAVFDVDEKAADRLVQTLRGHGVGANVAASVERAVVSHEIVVLATSDAVTPYVTPEMVVGVRLVIGISLNDLTEAAVRTSERWVTTDRQLLSYDLSSTARAVRAGAVSADRIELLEDLIPDSPPGHRPERERIVFDLWGLGMFDVALAAAAWRRQERDHGR
ncbi:hypothetical protein BHE97_04380 [Aeromicrobium sp. PE09-221]|uniref:hypothetical protein n=1 Tax=Aeromicrobium sp. PE09-221 TaxID=1898043 RepID=UPI000B3EA939|nr:hypothetical protein [Aeromicrobium sp. PE09-221]OUZ11581.1 hypothetical protein BHE97_04380 [Aeromicrobium sp. PE09-221]